MIDIGASEAPAVLGVSPHTTPWHLWARKVGLIADEIAETEPMRWGSRLESTVLQGFLADVLGGKVQDAITSPDTRRWLQERPWLRATPDAVILVDDSPVLVEVKTTVSVVPDVPRVDWICQVLHQRLAYPEATAAYLVAFGGLQMRYWLVPYHQAALDRVLREEERFLELCVKQIPPPVRAADASVLAKAWPITVPEPVQLNDAADELIDKRQLLMDALKTNQTWLDGIDANLKAALGEHEVGVTRKGSRIIWKHHERKGYTVEPQRVRRLTIKPGKESNGDEGSGLA